ncbi:MAG: DUF4981 domain-containing protein [Bacteroidales bacterium]|nr:DUF4981 domain-containing protein [Bacteroidales bacterium]
MKKALLIPALLAVLAAGAQTPPHRDIGMTGIGAQTRRTEVFFWPTERQALEGRFEQSPNYLDLNGEWDFAYADDDRQEPAWTKIRVPGNWEVQGFGTAIYVNIPYEFAPKDPQPPTLPEDIPVGRYRRTFTLPGDWAGREVYLNLAGAKSGVYVSINGRQAGYCEDSKSLARFDITPLLREGENEILLTIYRWSTGSYLECQDFWRLSGIERDVYLSSEARRRDFDFEVVSTLDESLQNGEFRLTVYDAQQFSYKLLDKEGKTVLEGRKEGNAGKDVFTGTVPGVRRWSAVTPELYTLLMQADGEWTRFHVGFRRLEITQIEKDGRSFPVFLVNGQPVKFKGVNLHEHNPETGHYVTREQVLQDLRLMRSLNINAIRTCHYPQPRFFYELCDSLGFYVYDEANVESHGMGYNLDRTLGNNPAWRAKHFDRILNMYRRTGNYPCVTILSLGNEAGNGVNFYEAYRRLKDLEKEGQNRPVCYERAEQEWNTDMLVPQYPGADWFRRMGEQGSDRPVVPSEYAHAMGNSTGSLDLQWEQIYKWPNLQGGFIWDWVDQGLLEQDGQGNTYFTYGGDYGVDMPSDNNFCCNGLVNPDRTPHPASVEVRHAYQDIHVSTVDPLQGRFAVTNRFYFRTLEGYQLRWWIEADGKKVREGSVALTAGPQQTQEFSARLPRYRRGKTYFIRFEAVNTADTPLLAKGTVVATGQEFLAQGAKSRAWKYSSKGVTAEETATEAILRSRKAELVFDKKKGIVTRYAYKGKDLVDSDFGIRPNFWRAPVDNDNGNGLPQRAAAWKQASHEFDAAVSLDGNAMTVIYTLPQGGTYTVVYTLDRKGILQIHSSLRGGTVPNLELPRLGLRMRLPASADRFRYFGRGPQENYWDRYSGTDISLYEASARESCYPYVRPQESGHHIDCTWLAIGGMTVVADPLFEFNALRCSIENLDNNPAEKPHKHINDIPVRDYVELCLDHRMTGVGGYDSWGARPEQDRTLWSDKDYDFNLTFVPGMRLSRILKTDFK